MGRYIALLRGINVGGKNKISMPALKSAFEQAGFSDVLTYINSGNIIFSSDESYTLTLQDICRQAIADSFGLDIPVAVLSAADWADALLHAPCWWDNDGESKHNAIIVIAPASPEAILASVGEAKPEYEKIACHGRFIFWSAPIPTFSRTRLSKITATGVYSQITIRNANTTKKLLELLS